MLFVTPIVCLLLGWGQAPGGADAVEDHQQRPQTSLYEVIQIRSGVEILVKGDGKQAAVRLLGIDTPRVSPKPEVDVLNQMKHLRGLIPIGARVSLETGTDATPDAKGGLLAQVRRAADGRWVNLEMLDQGYATTSTTQAFPARADFAAAEQRAKQGQLGMWAPNYLQVAVQPAQFVPPRRRPRPHRIAWVQAPRAGGGGQPGNAAGGNTSTSSSRGTEEAWEKKQLSELPKNTTASSSGISSSASSGNGSSGMAHSQHQGNVRGNNMGVHQRQQPTPSRSSHSFPNAYSGMGGHTAAYGGSSSSSSGSSGSGSYGHSGSSSSGSSSSGSYGHSGSSSSHSSSAGSSSSSGGGHHR